MRPFKMKFKINNNNDNDEKECDINKTHQVKNIKYKTSVFFYLHIVICKNIEILGNANKNWIGKTQEKNKHEMHLAV